VPVDVSFVVFGVEYMAEQFLAKFFQQEIFGLKVGVEGGSANVSTIDNFPNGDLMKILFGKQLCKGFENGLPCFSLASVHISLRTFLKYCSVSYSRGDLHIAFGGKFGMIMNR
jgi:hypothetical protein